MGVKSYLEQALEQAEQKIAKGDFRKGLGKLDDACWNVTDADSIEEFARIRELAERVVVRAEGRLAKKAQALVGLTEERRTAYLEGRVPKGLVPKAATVPVRAHDKPRAGCGVVVLGANLGAFVGGIVGAVTYAPDEFFGRGDTLLLAWSLVCSLAFVRGSWSRRSYGWCGTSATETQSPRRPRARLASRMRAA